LAAVSFVRCDRDNDTTLSAHGSSRSHFTIADISLVNPSISSSVTAVGPVRIASPRGNDVQLYRSRYWEDPRFPSNFHVTGNVLQEAPTTLDFSVALYQGSETDGVFIGRCPMSEAQGAHWLCTILAPEVTQPLVLGRYEAVIQSPSRETWDRVSFWIAPANITPPISPARCAPTHIEGRGFSESIVSIAIDDFVVCADMQITSTDPDDPTASFSCLLNEIAPGEHRLTLSVQEDAGAPTLSIPYTLSVLQDNCVFLPLVSAE